MINGEVSSEDETIVYDTVNQTFSSLLTMSVFNGPNISGNLSAAAWIENCAGFVQMLGIGAASVSVAPLPLDTACLRPPQISKTGNVALFGNARGKFDDNGELRFDGFDYGLCGPIVFTPERGTIQSLAGADLMLEDADLLGLVPLYQQSGISDDGRFIVQRVAFVLPDFETAGSLDYPTGLLLVNTESATVEFIDKHLGRGGFCSKCFSEFSIDTRISGDGSTLFYLRPPEGELTNPLSEHQLFRYDIATGVRTQIPVTDAVERYSIVTNRDGNRVAYLTKDDTLVLLDLDANEGIVVDDALRSCTDEGCEFESYRFISLAPAALSADGETMLIRVIPERADFDTPQNTVELMLLDVASRSLQRVAPGISVDRSEVSDNGDMLVFQTNSGGLKPDNNDFDPDVFFYQAVTVKNTT